RRQFLRANGAATTVCGRWWKRRLAMDAWTASPTDVGDAGQSRRHGRDARCARTWERRFRPSRPFVGTDAGSPRPIGPDWQLGARARPLLRARLEPVMDYARRQQPTDAASDRRRR